MDIITKIKAGVFVLAVCTLFVLLSINASNNTYLLLQAFLVLVCIVAIDRYGKEFKRIFKK